jgi:hypothetical protein
MKCNQKFFGQEHYEKGTSERAFCTSLRVLKPSMSQYDFALRDRIPLLPSDVGGLVQVKYNGMLSIIMWNEARGGFVSWNPRGRCYYSLNGLKKHPVTECFNHRLNSLRDYVFIGETHVIRTINGHSYMTPFNKTMSIIKNPQSLHDVHRIRLAVFDYARKKEAVEFERLQIRYIDRFCYLRDALNFPVSCDSNVVHLPDYIMAEGDFAEHYDAIQSFWNEFIRERGFEGLVLHTNAGDEYKLKFRDTLDVAVIAFSMTGNSRPVCEACGLKFDVFWLRKAAREGVVRQSEWLDSRGRLLQDKTTSWIRDGKMSNCPNCGGLLSRTAGPKLGAKIALMTSEGDFLDVADGAQFSLISPILNRIRPLYEADGYLWVKPEIVIEVSYQQLYVNSPRPLYRYDNGRYVRVGTKNAVSLRPYKPQIREDKTVNPKDLRLEQVNYLVKRIKRIDEMAKSSV